MSILEALSIIESNNLDANSEGFTFGVYSQPSDAVQYILGDAQHMANLADKMYELY